jgi:hypothetical protein
MKYEVSERVRTSKTADQILQVLEEQFKKISQKVQRVGQTIVATSIEASFGSINRSDTTTVSLRPAEDGWLVVADVNYRPSLAFWIIFAVTLFGTGVFWIIPIAFYLMQRNTVKTAIDACFRRIKNEFDQQAVARPPELPKGSSIDELEKLASLREKGIITDVEFEAKKKQILGL